LGSTYAGPDIGVTGGTIYVFDDVPGGIGFSEALMAAAAEWFERVVEQLSACGCDDGCPSCVLSPWCPTGNDRLSRTNGILVGRHLAAT
jgi:DEAD/DEAH box helicase domain-containing protein